MDEGRASYLNSLPLGISFDPCRCPKVAGYHFNEERKMWTCGECEKPGGSHRGYNPWCYYCGEPFTYSIAPTVAEKYPCCPTCDE